MHLQVGSLHSGQSFWQRDVVGSFFWTHTGELEHWTTSKASEMVSEITALAMASDDNARRSKSRQVKMPGAAATIFAEQRQRVSGDRDGHSGANGSRCDMYHGLGLLLHDVVAGAAGVRAGSAQLRRTLPRVRYMADARTFSACAIPGG